MRADALVVGAGPAGLYTAWALARRGLAVLVVEEHERVGEPAHCTGVLGVEAFQLPGVPRGPVLAEPHAARFHAPGGGGLDYEGPAGAVCVVDRGAFDRTLATAAEGAGARLRLGARAVGCQVERRGVRVRLHGPGRPETAEAAVCVLACGAQYGLQRRLGWGMPPLLQTSAQVEVADSASGSGTAGARLEVFFRADWGPTGFGWRVPVRRDGQAWAKVGVAVGRGAGRALRGLLEELQAAGRAGSAAGSPVVRALPLAPLERTFGDRVLAVGDAAGLVKPTTGGGIYYALLSAGWAAETLEVAFARGDFSAATLGGYEETWRAHLGRELRIGGLLRRAAACLAPEDLDALAELARRDGLLPLVRAHARFNWHAGLIVAVLRHPGVLRVVLPRLLRPAGQGR